MGKRASQLFVEIVKRKIDDGELPFFHLAPEEADVESEGLISPEYALETADDPELFRKMTDKYRKRLTSDWGIYPDKQPEALTNEEIVSGLQQVRGKGGANRIYFFPYPPTPDLGPNMTKALKGKSVYMIDMNDLEIQNAVAAVDWGRKGSRPKGKKRNKKFYENVTPEQYFAQYDDNGQPLFATLDHIGVEPKTGQIPPELLQKIQ